MDGIFTKLKEKLTIEEVVCFYGTNVNSYGKALCPFHKESTPSFSIKKDTNTFKCFGCGAGGDIFDFVAKLKNIDNLAAANLLAEDFHIDTVHESDKKLVIRKYIQNCAKNADKTDFFKNRGLKEETVKTFKLGFDEMKKCAVFPYNSSLTYYQSRNVDNKAFFKPKTEDAGSEPLFLANMLYVKNKDPVFVVESPICALSIIQCGGSAIALCGTSGINKLVSQLKNKPTKNNIIISLDNDEPGKKAAAELSIQLGEIKAKYAVINISGEYKDPNALLMSDSEKLKENIAKAKSEVKKKYQSEKDSFSAAELQAENVENPDWIVERILPSGLAMLCAPSKIGKSWMVLQLCIKICGGEDFLSFKTNKHSCLYYALEDSKARLKDRMNKILKGGIAPDNLHFAIHADTLDSGLTDKIKEELSAYPDIKLVVIDTFQKVRARASKNELLYSSDYREMGSLKDFADRNKISLLLVHHLRKMTDESDVFNMISGSTALMGAADSVFIISKKRRNDSSATLTMTGRDIQQDNLVISFNKADYVWEVEGTAEEIEMKNENREYKENVFVLTIKELVKKNSVNGWKGTAQELLRAVYDYTGKMVAESSTSVGKIISKYENRLYCDGIEHQVSRSRKREHTFRQKMTQNTAFQYSFYDTSNEK